MDLLSFDLRCYVHRDLVQFELQVLNLAANFIDRARRRLVLVVLIRLRDQEVDFLRFTVKLLPAQFEFFLARGFELELPRCITINSLLLLFPLECLYQERKVSSRFGTY